MKAKLYFIHKGVHYTSENTLYLTLFKEYFDAIDEGTKTIEYREDSPHWQSRLMRLNEFKKFDFVFFKNGYNPKSPIMLIECKGIRLTDCFEIDLGEKIYVRR